MLKGIDRHLNDYRFNEAANLLYAFLWHEFCDWYLEIAKNNLKETSTQLIMYKMLEKFLRVLHPFMPFITEEIWQGLPNEGESIMVHSWPHVQEKMIDKKIESKMHLIFDIIKLIRNLRSQIDLKPNQKAPVSIYPYKKVYQRLIEDNRELIVNLANLERLDILVTDKRPQQAISDITKSAGIYLHFSCLIDVNRERDKIKQNMHRQAVMLKGKKTRIENRDFLKKAPREVIKKEKESIAEIENAIKRLEQMYNELR